MTFQNFDILLIDPAAARVITSPSDETTAPRALKLDVDELAARYRQLLAHPKLEKANLIELGMELFDALVSGSIARLFYKSIGALEDEDAGLRLRLCIESPALMRLPWELMYSQDDGGFLSTSKRFSLSRYLPVPHPVEPTQVGLPLRILVVISSPSNLPRLDFRHECRILEDALAKLVSTRGVDLIFEQDARREYLLTRLQQEKFHVLHFVGHGGWVADRGAVALIKEDGQADLVDAETFAGILSASMTLRLVILNACQTAHEEAKSGFAGVGSQLIAQGIPAVIAMRDAIQDKAAIAFAKHLYGNLAGGASIDIALTHTRQQLHLNQGDHPAAFGIPALYLHAPDGNLFCVVSSRKKRLVGVAQQIARLNETCDALAEWKELHDILQRLSKPIESVYRIAANPEGAALISWVLAPFHQDLDSHLIPFASKRIRFIGRRYQITNEGLSGEEWAVRTIQLSADVDKAISAVDAAGIRGKAGELRTLIFKYMSVCNRQMVDLLAQSTRLYVEAKDILDTVKQEETRLKYTTLNWTAIESDLLDLEACCNRIAEWLRFHDLFDSLHIECARFYSQALVEKSVDPIAKSWVELRDTLVANFLKQAKAISLIGEAYIEHSDGGVSGEAWIIDIKRKSDQLTANIGERNIVLTQESIANLNKLVTQQYSQIDMSIKDEIKGFTKCSVALHARVTA
ncbi:MAG: CHAT domain-containing protein [Chloroflexi bacterium]|nr:CHAT domain-containing protein [Chloroflexota bacterium]